MASIINKMDPTNQPGASPIAKPTMDNLCPSSFNQNELCAKCQGIDFDAVMVEQESKRETIARDVETEWSLGTVSYSALEESARSCKLCHFFINSFDTEYLVSKGAIEEPIMVSLDTTTRVDRGLRRLGFNSIVLPIKDYCRPYFNLYQDLTGNRDIRAFKSHHIEFCRRPVTDHAAVRFRIPPPQIPWDLVRTWLEFCRCHHGIDCSQGEPSTLGSLRLIDCEATPRKVVPYSSGVMSYAALSYVWGASVENVNTRRSLASGNLPLILPRSIEDAITVATTLGFRYLWVDQYCIPQDDENEKPHQIQLIDEIYHRAELTLIAAAGRDASYGLPGVGATPRKLLRSIKIGVDTLIDIPEHTFSLPYHAANWL